MLGSDDEVIKSLDISRVVRNVRRKSSLPELFLTLPWLRRMAVVRPGVFPKSYTVSGSADTSESLAGNVSLSE